MLYKFTYYNNNRLVYKTCYTEREAEVFFALLVSAKYCFRVQTIIKRHHYQNK